VPEIHLSDVSAWLACGSLVGHSDTFLQRRDDSDTDSAVFDGLFDVGQVSETVGGTFVAVSSSMPPLGWGVVDLRRRSTGATPRRV
jgi:hypothetical protein